MPPQQIKVLAFAKLAGVGKTAIYKARDAGKIKVVNGLIDISDPGSLEYLQSAQLRKKLEHEAESSAVEVQEDAVKYLPEEVRAGASNGTTSKKRDLEEARLSKQNRELDLKYQRDRKELLSRESLEQVFTKLYSIEVAKFHGLSHALTPDIAVIYENVDNEKMTKTADLIDGAVFSTLDEIKKLLNDYLASVEAEEMEEEKYNGR